MKCNRGHKIRAVSLLFCFILLLNGCAGPSKSGDSRRNQITDPILGPESGSEEASAIETRDYQEIEAFVSKNLYESAESKMARFSKRHPKSSLLPSVENLHGLLLLKKKQAPQAILHFKKSISLNASNPVFNQYVLYNLATAQFEANQLDDAQQTASQIDPNALDKANRLKVFYLKATLYHKKSLPLEAARQLLSAGKLLSETDSPENHRLLNRFLDQILQNIADASTLGTLYRDFEDSPVADTLLMRLATQELSSGNVGDAELHLRTLMSRFPQSPYYVQAAEALSHPQAQEAVDSRSVGVLLPMKGKFGKFGAKSLQGIQLAFGIFSHSDPDSKIQLIVEDSGEEPEQAVKALQRLVSKHHVVAVIGPMLSKGVDQISQKAHELGVPLISLSRRSVPPMEYVFQGGITPQLQAAEVARYAIQRLSLRRFAILYPNDKGGTEISQTFWDAVESLGGKIVGIEAYQPGETDFRQPVDKLSGLYYAEARQRELDLLAQEREANKVTRRTRKTEQFYNLRPIVDYDAVFIPDDPKVAGQILPTFAYRDIENVKFLGTSAWNSPDFLARAQSYGEGAAFADAFTPDAKSTSAQGFFEKYKTAFGQEPTSLEAIAYDAGAVVNHLLTRSPRLSRAELREQLKSVRDFPGITGRISFKEGSFFRDLRIIRVKNGKFVEAP